MGRRTDSAAVDIVRRKACRLAAIKDLCSSMGTPANPRTRRHLPIPPLVGWLWAVAAMIPQRPSSQQLAYSPAVGIYEV